jgi:hypothetical protein
MPDSGHIHRRRHVSLLGLRAIRIARSSNRHSHVKHVHPTPDDPIKPKNEEPDNGNHDPEQRRV